MVGSSLRASMEQAVSMRESEKDYYSDCEVDLTDSCADHMRRRTFCIKIHEAQEVVTSETLRRSHCHMTSTRYLGTLWQLSMPDIYLLSVPAAHLYLYLKPADYFQSHQSFYDRSSLKCKYIEAVVAVGHHFAPGTALVLKRWQVPIYLHSTSPCQIVTAYLVTYTLYLLVPILQAVP